MSQIETNAKMVLEKNIKQLAVDMIDSVVVPAIEEAVAKTSNQFDDMALAALKTNIVAEAKKLIEKIDFTKEA